MNQRIRRNLNKVLRDYYSVIIYYCNPLLIHNQAFPLIGNGTKSLGDRTTFFAFKTTFGLGAYHSIRSHDVYRILLRTIKYDCIIFANIINSHVLLCVHYYALMGISG